MHSPARLFPGILALAFACAPLMQAETTEERGKYLVEEIAKCADCHTPATETGEPDRARWLKGAVLPFAPIEAVKNWHKTAPDITSASRLFQKWGEPGMVKFLTTGRGPSGNAADAPMPGYRLKQDDAEAIVAYLKSLK
jgi:mono/diheme cytochrome c family protein